MRKRSPADTSADCELSALRKRLGRAAITALGAPMKGWDVRCEPMAIHQGCCSC